VFFENISKNFDIFLIIVAIFPPNHQENQKQNQDIQKIKSVFTPQILEQNSTLSDEFKKLDNEKERQGALNKILDLLKSDNGKILKSITEQL
jgi:hypothetical protein